LITVIHVPTIDYTWLFCLGLSNFNSKQVDDIIEKGRIKPAVNQVECHPYLNQAELVEHCKKKGVVGEAIIPHSIKFIE